MTPTEETLTLKLALELEDEEELIEKLAIRIIRKLEAREFSTSDAAPNEHC